MPDRIRQFRMTSNIRFVLGFFLFYFSAYQFQIHFRLGNTSSFVAHNFIRSSCRFQDLHFGWVFFVKFFDVFFDLIEDFLELGRLEDFIEDAFQYFCLVKGPQCVLFDKWVKISNRFSKQKIEKKTKKNSKKKFKKISTEKWQPDLGDKI